MADVQIDDSLYSRQRYVLGDGAMQRMAKSNVLLVGAGGLGIEIAKNLVLAGIKSLTIQDHRPSITQDLGCQFFIRDSDVAQSINRAKASCGRVAELNPYVTVNTKTTELTDSSDLSYLLSYQCVVLTECSLTMQKHVNSFCRSQNPSIKCVFGDVHGVFSSLFCDFGPEFEVGDATGEELKQFFVGDITSSNPGNVSTLEYKLHGLVTGDYVKFKEVQGMTELNDQVYQIEVIDSSNFTICDTSNMGRYTCGGIVTEVNKPTIVHFSSLESQLLSPSLLMVDLCKFDAPANIHLCLLTLQSFLEANKRKPNAWCDTDAAAFITLAQQVNQSLVEPLQPLSNKLIHQFAYTCRGMLAPLCAAVGGVAAQECLKALTGKFHPLQQWLHLDACEIVPETATYTAQRDRYDLLRACIGADLCTKLSSLKLFMVGCGAIGCEMLKNYATLGIATAEGQITITDNDLIEKSNLNRQFLFRPHHIRQPKSTTAAASVCEINAALHIDAQQHKVCPDTEAKVYNDGFFEAQDIVVNALDNVEARRYVDSRCVTTQRALLESGTMGAKGHVQVIVPHLTESYTSQRDPVDEDVPYCTLKSFPAVIEHCIQWARDKFESSFTQKPVMYNKFWSSNTNESATIDALLSCQPLQGAIQMSHILKCRPSTWQDCVQLARLKFEKYFNHKAKNLLHAFPLDTKLKDGAMFWQSPKRPPTPQLFDINNSQHFQFIVACSRLFADMNAVSYNTNDLSKEYVNSVISAITIPEFKPSSKRIETDESVKKSEADAQSAENTDEFVVCGTVVKRFVEQHGAQKLHQQMLPHQFEKDDDSNAHIDYITAAANLRAIVYGIEPADRLAVKRIAGRIVPAIATTTAAVAGLVTIELIKVIKQVSMESYKNCFLNLALPMMVLSEPGPAVVTVMSSGTKITAWDRWEVKGNAHYTLQMFIENIRERYNLEVSLVVHGAKMIYVPFMPGHKKKLSHKMTKLIKAPAEKTYVDLVVSYAMEPEDEMGPMVRYYLH